jgi:hypothetical protein
MWPWQIKPAVRYCEDVIAIMKFLARLVGKDNQTLITELKTQFALDAEDEVFGGPYCANDDLALILSRNRMNNDLLVSLCGVEQAAGFRLYVHGLDVKSKAEEISFALEIAFQPLFRHPGPTNLGRVCKIGQGRAGRSFTFWQGDE